VTGALPLSGVDFPMPGSYPSDDLAKIDAETYHCITAVILNLFQRYIPSGSIAPNAGNPFTRKIYSDYFAATIGIETDELMREQRVETDHERFH